MDQLPEITSDGSLREPKDWETWVMVGSSTGLSYATPGAAPVAGAAPGMFHNVYLQPWAYREFVKTGVFPEGSMFVLAFYEASRKSAPAKAADTASIGTQLPASASCYSCHAKEAAHDNVFTQFYPPIRERLARASQNTAAR